MQKRQRRSVGAVIRAAKPINIRRAINTMRPLKELRLPLKIRTINSLERELGGLARLTKRLEGTTTTSPLHSTRINQDLATVEERIDKIRAEIARKRNAKARSYL